ncbi:hypothetical protein MMC25_001938 [Agyrium rufum]|nr:hypothetical protein [Agyrium rufum]
MGSMEERRLSADTQRQPSTAEAIAHQRTKKGVSDHVATGASELTVRQSIIPVSLVTILFFLWGFAYGLLDVLNKHFQEVLNVSQGQGSSLAAAYFGGYFLGPLTWSGWIVRHWGYRWTFITGLCIYGIGALMFWPSAVKRSFGGFCGSMFIVGSGLSTLETSANPFIATCGPPRYSEIRLNLAQAFQAIGTVVAPLLASNVIFQDIGSPGGKSLASVQWVYLGIACFVFCLAVVFFFAPIPEVTDADMEEVEETTENTGYAEKPLKQQYMLFWGVIAQFCYVGSQVAIAGYFINYVVFVRPGTTSSTGSNQLAIAQGLFAIGRFSAAFGMRWIRPRIILLTFMTGCIIFICCAMGVGGNVGIACLSLVLFFESCIFPTIFTLSLRGLGRHTKRGASFLVSAVSGGAVFPPALGAVADARNTQVAMCIPLVGFLIAWSFPIYLNLFKRAELDNYLVSDIGVGHTGGHKDSAEIASTSGSDAQAEKGMVTHKEIEGTSPEE